MIIKKLRVAAFAASFVAVVLPAQADIKIGVVLALTGPNASLGVPYRKGVELFPKEIGGEKVQLIFLDDASDPSTAVKNAQKLIADDNIDILIGGSNSPASQAMAARDLEGRRAAGLARACRLRGRQEQLADRDAAAGGSSGPRRSSRTCRSARSRRSPISASAIRGATSPITASRKPPKRPACKVVTNERYARADTSVAGQMLKIIAAKPDAVMVGGSGTPGALPHIALAERGFKGPVYATPGVFNQDFLRIGGKSLEDTVGVTGPIGGHEQLPASNPIKKVSEDFIKKYEDINGKGSWNSFAAFAYDGNADACGRDRTRAQEGQARHAGIPQGGA